MTKFLIELALFAYGGISPETFDSAIAELSTGAPIVLAPVTFIAGDALISRTRSRAATLFLRRTGDLVPDVLVMVDHDMAWQPGDLTALAAKAFEINAPVAGLYAGRSKEGGFSSRPVGEPTFKLGGNGLHKADFLATGFLAIPRSTLQRVVDCDLVHACVDNAKGDTIYDFFQCMTVPVTRDDIPGEFEFLSEDWSFSQRARDAGLELFIYEKPILKHFGNHGYTIQEG